MRRAAVKYPKWFKKLPVGRNQESLRRKLQRQTMMPELMSIWSIPLQGKVMNYRGTPIRVYTLYDITRILGRNKSKIVYEWYYEGILPDPFLVVPILGKDSPLYLKGQVRAIWFTMHYLHSNGVLRITKKSHMDLIIQMHEGAKISVKYFLNQIEQSWVVKPEEVRWIKDS